MSHKKSPAGAGTPAGQEPQDEREAAIKTAIHIMPHTSGRRNHVIIVSRAPQPRHGRDWLVSYNHGPAFAIKAKQLRSWIRFSRVMTHAIPGQLPACGDNRLRQLQHPFPRDMERAMQLLIGGGAHEQ